MRSTLYYPNSLSSPVDIFEADIFEADIFESDIFEA